MANSINFGKIYETTWWGSPVKDGWGGIYYNLAGFTLLTERYQERVEADGGVVEALSCVNSASFNDRNLNWTYYFRVVDNGGIVESLQCVTI